MTAADGKVAAEPPPSDPALVAERTASQPATAQPASPQQPATLAVADPDAPTGATDVAAPIPGLPGPAPLAPHAVSPAAVAPSPPQPATPVAEPNAVVVIAATATVPKSEPETTDETKVFEDRPDPAASEDGAAAAPVQAAPPVALLPDLAIVSSATAAAPPPADLGEASQASEEIAALGPRPGGALPATARAVSRAAIAAVAPDPAQQAAQDAPPDQAATVATLARPTPGDATRHAATVETGQAAPAPAFADLLAAAPAARAPDLPPPLPAATPTAATATAAVGAAAPAAAAIPLAQVPVEIGLKSLAGLSRFEIRLAPVELGRIDVQLDIDQDGRVRAHLQVERPETLAALQRHSGQLDSALQQAGLRTDDGSLALSLRDPSAGTLADGRERQGGERAPAPPAAEIPARPAASATIAAAVDLGRRLAGGSRPSGIDLSV